MNSITRCYVEVGIFVGICLISFFIAITKNEKIISIIKKNIKLIFFLAIGTTIVGKYAGILAYMGAELFVKDFNLFLMWSNELTSNGFKGFMVEYPAGSLYILTALRGLQKVLGFGDNYIVSSLLLKTPAIIADIIIAVFVYKIAKKHMDPIKSFSIFLFMLFLPTQLINSSFWGQVDGILILFIVLSLYYLDEDKRFLAALFYTISCLIKAQAIFFAPVFGMFYIMPLIRGTIKIRSNEFFKNYIYPVTIGFVIFFVATLPFKERFTDIWLLDYFKHISSEHPHNTMSALNLFGLHGGNAISDTASFLFMDYKTWGYIFIFVICIACAAFSFNKKHHLIYQLAAFCMASIYMFGVSMHERYILPVIALMLLAYVMDGDGRKLALTIVYSVLGSINQSMILFDLFGGRTSAFRLLSGLSLIIYVYMAYVIVSSLYSSKRNIIYNLEKIA